MFYIYILFWTRQVLRTLLVMSVLNYSKLILLLLSVDNIIVIFISRWSLLVVIQRSTNVSSNSSFIRAWHINLPIPLISLCHMCIHQEKIYGIFTMLIYWQWGLVMLYDKRDDFNFPIVNFPYIGSNNPGAPAYGVYIFLSWFGIPEHLVHIMIASRDGSC